MFPPIYEVCGADAAVQTVLGNPVRMWPFGQVPQGTVRPYAVWQTITGFPENYLDRPPDMDLFALQVDVYGTTATGARHAAEALRDAIEPRAHVAAWRGETREEDTKLYRYSFDVDWWTPR